MGSGKRTKRLRALLSIVLCIAMLLPDLGVFAPERVEAATSENLIKNSDFTDPYVTDVTQGWKDINGNSANYWSVAEDGSLKFSASTAPTSAPTLEQKITGLTVGNTYVLSGKVKVVSGTLQITYWVNNTTVYFANYTASTDGWIELSERITVTSGNAIAIKIIGATKVGEAYVDDLSLKATSDINVATNNLLNDTNFSTDWQTNWTTSGLENNNITVSSDNNGKLSLDVSGGGNENRSISQLVRNITVGEEYLLSAKLSALNRTNSDGYYALRFAFGGISQNDNSTVKYTGSYNAAYYYVTPGNEVYKSVKIKIPETFALAGVTYNVDRVKVELVISKECSAINTTVSDLSFGLASTNVPTAEVGLSQTSADLIVGDSVTLTATVLPENATDKSVTWTTSDNTVATVSNGVVTAVGAGTATITATASGGQTATCAVTVATPDTTVATTGITLDKNTETVAIGDSVTLTATVLPEDATNKTVTWTTSDSSVATVSGGVVTAVSSGTATITATASGGQIATCTITVPEPDYPDVIVDTTNYVYNPTFGENFEGWKKTNVDTNATVDANGILTITTQPAGGVKVALEQTILEENSFSAGIVTPGKYLLSANVAMTQTVNGQDTSGGVYFQYYYVGKNASGTLVYGNYNRPIQHTSPNAKNYSNLEINVPEEFTATDGNTYDTIGLRFEIQVPTGTKNWTITVSDVKLERDNKVPLNPLSGGLLENVNYETHTPDDASTIQSWNAWSSDSTDGGYTAVVTTENETEKVLKVNVTQDEFTLYQTYTPTVYGKYYVLTGKIKTEGFTKVDSSGKVVSDGSAQLYVRLLDDSASNTEIAAGAKYTAYISGDTEWKDYIVIIPVPETLNGKNVAKIKVEHKVNFGTGTAYFKDLKLVATDIPYDAANVIQNPAYICQTTNMIQSWNYSPANFTTNKATVSVTTEEVAEGVVANVVTLKGNPNTAQQQMYQQVTNIDTNVTYRLTGYVKATDLTGNAILRVRLTDTSLNANGNPANAGIEVAKNLVTVTGTTEWIPIDVTFDVPAYFYAKATDADAKEVGGFKLEKILPAGQTGSVSFANLKIVKTNETLDTVNYPITGDANNSLFVNGGFERYYDGLPRWWNVWESTGGLKVSADTSVKHSGNYSLHIQNVTEGEESRGSVHQTIQNKYDENGNRTLNEIPDELQQQSVKITQYIKTSDWEGSGFSIRLQYKSKNGVPVELTSKSIKLEKTQDWTKYEFILDLPTTDLNLIKLEYLYDECVGDVWIDDLTVETYVKATGISTSKDAVILKAGEEEQLEVTLNSNSNLVEATEQTVTYTSSNENVITVDATGKIKAVNNGYAKVIIKQADGCEKEVAVLVIDSAFSYNETITTIATDMNNTKTGVLPSGYIYEVLAKPQYGAVIVKGTMYTYYPDKNFSGNDTVTFLVTNANSEKTLVTWNITVGQISSNPVFENFLITTNMNTTANGGMVASDIETDTKSLVYTISQNPAHGTLVLSGDTYTFVPAVGYYGYDTAKVTVTDGEGKTATATVNIYIAPSTSKIQDLVTKEHTYLLADDEKFAELAELIKTDTMIADWFEDVKATTDPLLSDSTPVPYNCPDGVRLDTQGSKDVMNLAFMYRVTGEQKYFDRAWLELENLCNPAEYPDWHPSHLLDVAMTASGVAIAYDWLYASLSADQRAYVEAALYKNALLEGEFQYEDNHMFVTNGFNWNYVCNGGFATAAFALLTSDNDEYAAKAAEIIQRAYKSIQYGLPQYAPEGDSIEGVSYWDYGTRYLVSFLAVVTSATDSNPFLGTPGIFETALYPIHMTGKAGSFNYSDNDTADAVGYLNLWLAEAYDEPSYAWYHQYYMSKPGNKASIYDLLYYNAEYYNSTETPDLDNYYSAQAVTTMRHDYDDPNSAYLGFKGGIAGAPHGDLDIGTFIYDLYGIRWAVDTGKENYNILGYWELNPGAVRWDYYRKDASGHNTLVINPENPKTNPEAAGENQTIGTYAGKIAQSINNPGGGYTILDMTDTYQRDAASLQRGVAFFNRTQVLVRDEFILKAVGDVYWQMHTEAEVTISADGKTATLTQGGKQIEIKIVGEDNDYTFATMAAVFYGDDESAAATGKIKPSSGTGADHKEQFDRTNYTKLYIKAANVQEGSISVLITPLGEDVPEVKTLDKWSEYDFSTLKVESGSTPETPSTGGTNKPSKKPSNNSGTTTPSTEEEVTEEVEEVTYAPTEAVKQQLEDMVSAIIEKLNNSESLDKMMSKETQEKLMKAIEEGKEIVAEIVLENKAEAAVDEEVKTLFEDAIQSFAEENGITLEVAQYMDIQLLLSTEDAEVLGNLLELEENITITLRLPEELQKDGRVFYVARNHNGVVDILDTKEVSRGVISFETDRFSDYVLIYEDVDVTDEDVDVEELEPSTEDNEEKDDKQEIDGSLIWIFVVLAFIAVVVVAVIRKKGNKK